jgi:polysaccharide export outer membrane protein
MKKSAYIIGIVLLISLSFLSCRTTRDMKFLQNLSNNELVSATRQPPLYKIKVDDNLYIDIQSTNPELDKLFSNEKSGGISGGTQSNYGDLPSQYINGYQVNDKGTITLPIMGRIEVLNKTEEEAQSAIQKKVDEYFQEATVRVKLLTYKVSILGEVRNPGTYHNYNKTLSILEAISMANGTTDIATVRRVLVVRPTENGNKSYRIDLTNKDAMKSEAYYLMPNDVLYVEPDKFKNFALNSTAFSLTLSAITTTVLLLTYINK